MSFDISKMGLKALKIKEDVKLEEVFEILRKLAN